MRLMMASRWDLFSSVPFPWDDWTVPIFFSYFLSCSSERVVELNGLSVWPCPLSCLRKATMRLMTSALFSSVPVFSAGGGSVKNSL